MLAASFRSHDLSVRALAVVRLLLAAVLALTATLAHGGTPHLLGQNNSFPGLSKEMCAREDTD